MKVKFNQSIAGRGFSFRKNQVVELGQEAATEYLNAGFCEAVKQTRSKAVSDKKEQAELIDND